MNAAEEVFAETREDSAKQWKTPAERARSLGTHGARLPTGFPTLDRAMRGGLMPGRITVLGGAPGAGKTSFIVQLAREYDRKGHPVAILAADEDADGLLVRWGQQGGLSRDALEAGDEKTRNRLATSLEFGELMLVDADEERVTVEDVVEELARRSSKKTGVLVVDSIQKARTRAPGTDTNARDKVDATMQVLSAAAKKHGFLVIVTSEVSRGSYAGYPKPVDDLAAFKESGGIEYGASVALVIRCSPHAANLFEVSIPKNRLGTKPPFWLEFDIERATFREVDAPVRHGATGERSTDARERVLSVLRTGEVFSSRSALARKAGGKKQTTLEAIAVLIKAGAIEETGKGIFLARQGSEQVPVPGSPYKGENREPDEPRASVPVPVSVPGTGNQERTSTGRVKGRSST